MITSLEAKNIIELSFNEYITVLLKLRLSVKLIERWKEDLIGYISQQEKVTELLGLKNEMINAYQAYLASLHTIDRHMIDKWKNEIFRLQNVIYTKEKELGEMK